MKSLILVLAIFTSAAFAGEVPSVLPDGKYNYECWSTDVRQLTTPVEMKREFTYATGVATYATKENVTVVNDKSSGLLGGMSFSYDATTTLSYEKLEDGTFRETGDTVSTDSFGGQTSTSNYKSIRVFSVFGSFESNITVQINDDAPKVGLSETAVKTLEDGRIAVSTNLREKSNNAGHKLGEGHYSIPSLSLIGSSLCLYKKAE